MCRIGWVSLDILKIWKKRNGLGIIGFLEFGDLRKFKVKDLFKFINLGKVDFELETVNSKCLWLFNQLLSGPD